MKSLTQRVDAIMRDILTEFGFCGYNSLFGSLLRTENIKFLGVFAGIGVLAEGLLGLSPYSLLILFALILVELGLGIAAGVKRTKKFRVRMLQRFGLKVFIYFLLLLVLNTYQTQYFGRVEYYVYASLHSFSVFYVIGVYLISILENANYLIGGSKEFTGLLKLFRIKIKEHIKDVEGTVFEDDKRNKDKKE